MTGPRLDVFGNCAVCRFDIGTNSNCENCQKVWNNANICPCCGEALLADQPWRLRNDLTPGMLETEQPVDGEAYVHAWCDDRLNTEAEAETGSAEVEVADPDEVAYCVKVERVSGFPDSIINDLSREDAPETDRLYVAHFFREKDNQSAVLIKALDDGAMKWLYDWFEDTRQYYRENYVDASAEHDAARDLAEAVYEAMSSGGGHE